MPGKSIRIFLFTDILQTPGDLNRQRISLKDLILPGGFLVKTWQMMVFIVNYK
jgi:hypothetical protein